ncbi:MAG: sigma 54-interacting transcriptional regulator [Planctomycetia bacterium]
MPRPLTPADRPALLGRVLVVDDDRRMASGRAQWLCGQGWHASAVGTAEEASALVGRGRFAACVIDGLLADGAADRWLAVVRATSPATGLVIAFPAEAACEVAVADATTSLRDDDLLAALDRARAAGRSRAAARATEPQVIEPTVLGEHATIQRALDLVGRVATTPATVLITGESGTGKSLVARQIHQASGRAGRFVEVACGSLSESLLESELFGHVAGAFTGAASDRPGKFLQADGGTIFLDEVATASPAMQVKLLRVLQQMQFEPVGGAETRTVDARVILATNENLENLVAEGRFRADLYWRINVVAIEMPALRSRPDDIPLLATHFLARAAAKAGRTVEGFSPAAIDALLRHPWPGNVRELEHAVERAVFLGRGPFVDLADLPPAVVGAAKPAAVAFDARAATPLKAAMAHPERQLIIDALERSGWRRDAAARALGINRTTLYKKLKRLGMDLTSLEPR